MVIKEEQERVRMLLSDTITLLCRNGLTFKSEFCISALIGITLDKEDVILVDIRETIKNYEDHEKLNDNNGNAKVKNKARKNRKKRRHSSSNSNSESSSDDGDSDEVEKKVKSDTYLDKDEGSDDLVFVKTEPGLDDSSNSIISNQQTEFLGYSGSQSMLGNTSANHAQPMTSGFSPNLGYDPGSQLPFIPQLPPDGQQFAGSSQEAANGTNPPSMQPQMNTSQLGAGGTSDIDGSFVCHVCGKKCTTKRTLRGHLIQRHGATALSYNCPVCKKQYTRADNLTRHMRQMHNSAGTENN